MGTEAILTAIYEHGIHQRCPSAPCIWISQLSGLIGKLYYYLVALLGIASTFSDGPILMNEPGNDVRLAVSPRCGLLPGVVSDVNTGINIGAIKTIISFGDSYTDGGNDDAGGRSANGPVWIEGLADNSGAVLLSYAQWGACIDLSIWPSNPRKVDFIGQMSTFLNQDHDLDPESTLYSLFFGIKCSTGDHLDDAAEALLEQINRLSSPPINGRLFMISDVYGQGEHAVRGERFKQIIYDGLYDFHVGYKHLDIAYVDFGRIWDGVLGATPGYEAFGYASTDQCTECYENCDKNGWCDDPDHHFYWIPGHPSKETHRIMADYVYEVLTLCHIS
ncbi:uncharacterized protein EV420DRAFT_1530538 [Desarmillaria tabescens]|uniref:Carbohydrate esterase family 16 protein n=1 Tax=Armillaria tabescens TaxID=1929756 RepID=A0AA39N8S4_ARMTA|nr:uncharacterized protein EV420DRAFT_1530538 [Desarmillaria tabescens]KAK0461140.1 hypothetical protein EV420DRAFT_1530538 [Desarmillaria tabescens]